jgi:hypothetical protein
MKTKIITSIILVVTLAIWLVWDVVVATNEPKGDTISEITLATSYLALFIPAAWGVIMGHLFWPSMSLKYKWPRIYVLWGWAVVLLVLSIFKVVPSTMYTIPIVFLIHFLMGHYLWPQKAQESNA